MNLSLDSFPHQLIILINNLRNSSPDFFLCTLFRTSRKISNEVRTKLIVFHVMVITLQIKAYSLFTHVTLIFLTNRQFGAGVMAHSLTCLPWK